MPLVIDGDHEFNLSHEEQEKLDQFQVITSFPEDDLRLVIKLLQNYGWHLERALSAYYDNNWKEALDSSDQQPLIADRPATASVTRTITSQVQAGSPFLISDLSLVPSLQLVKPLPPSYLENYSVVGLNKRKDEIWQLNQGQSPLFLILLFIPRLLGKLGMGLLSIIWGIITFGFRSNLNDKPKVSKIPNSPSQESVPLRDLIPQVVDEESVGALQKIISQKKPFNEVLKICEDEFKYLLVILIGHIDVLESEKCDKNSQLLLSKIMTNKKVLSLIESHQKDLLIYIGSVEEIEPWLVARQLHVRYTPDCLLIGNVLNSNGSVNGMTRLSVLSKLRMTSAKKFYNSLKLTIEKFNSELVVSRNEKEELRIARDIRKRQDAAYEESLRQEKAKDEKRQEEREKLAKKQNLEEEGKRNLKLQKSAKVLFWIDSCLNLLEKDSFSKSAGEDTTMIQFRTSQGNRLIQKFESDTTLRTVYITVGCFLYLNEIKIDQDTWVSKINTKLMELSEDESVLCFKNKQTSLPPIELSKIRKLVTAEFNEIPDKIAAPLQGDFDFELISPFPRQKIPADESIIIKDFKQLWPKGSLLVEDVMEDEESSDSENDNSSSNA